MKFNKSVIATGARSAAPPIPGLNEAGFLTNESVFNLTELPRSLAVIGGGPIGCEMAQSFARFGSEVYLLQRSEHILSREDHDASEIVENALVKDGIKLIKGCTTQSVDSKGSTKKIRFECPGENMTISVDEILVAVGRAPNVTELNLSAVDVAYDERKGVFVNEVNRLST